MNSLSCLGHVKRNKDGHREPSPPLIVDIEFMIDRSGSMYTMEKETENGTREFVKSQKEMANKTGIRTYIRIQTFDNRVETMYGFDGCDIIDTPEIDINCLIPRGTTRLIDTACDGLYAQEMRYKKYVNGMAKEVKQLNPTIIRIFALITDGQDNESTLFGSMDLNNLIIKQKEHGVICMFLGANQDAIHQGQQFGFDAGYSLTYGSHGKTATNALRAVSEQITRTCTGEKSTHFDDFQRSSSVPVNNTDDREEDKLYRTMGLHRC